MADEKDKSNWWSNPFKWANDRLREHDETWETGADEVISEFANPLAVRILDKWSWLADPAYSIPVNLVSRIPFGLKLFIKDNPILEILSLTAQRIGQEFREEYKRRRGKSLPDDTRDTVAGHNVTQVHATPKGVGDDLTQAGRILMAMSLVTDNRKRNGFWGWYGALDNNQWDKFNQAIAGIPDEKLVELVNNTPTQLEKFMQAIPDKPAASQGWTDLFDVFKDVHVDPELMGWVREYLAYVKDLYEPAFAENRDAFWNAALSEAKTIAKFKEIMSLMTPTALNPNGWTDAINKFLKVNYRTSEVPKFSVDRILEEEGYDLDGQLAASETALDRARAARDAARERLGGN